MIKPMFSPMAPSLMSWYFEVPVSSCITSSLLSRSFYQFTSVAFVTFMIFFNKLVRSASFQRVAYLTLRSTHRLLSGRTMSEKCGGLVLTQHILLNDVTQMKVNLLHINLSFNVLVTPVICLTTENRQSRLSVKNS